MRLRPSMRENFRYILIHIVPEQTCDQRDIYRAVAESVTSLYGDSVTAAIWPSVMKVSGPFAIIRCRRGTEKRLETALAAITGIQGSRAAVHPVRTSGTIQTLVGHIPGDLMIRPGKAVISGNTCDVLVSSRGRIDLKEKGIYLEIPRYITEEDTEDLYYDE